MLTKGDNMNPGSSGEEVNTERENMIINLLRGSLHLRILISK